MVPLGLSSPLYSVHWLSIVLYYNLVASPKQNASQHAIYTIAIVTVDHARIFSCGVSSLGNLVQISYGFAIR